jgi:hypothetical protein
MVSDNRDLDFLQEKNPVLWQGFSILFMGLLYKALPVATEKFRALRS